MDNSETQKYSWTNNDGQEIATIEIDEQKGIDITVDLEVLGSHRKEMEELLTLGLYPPRDEEKAKGIVSEDGKKIVFETKKGQKWELAKVDIVNTFHFWFGK